VVSFGNHHVGDTVGVDLGLTNGAATGGFSEALDATLSGATAGLLASGTVTGLAAGVTNTTSLLVGLNTGSAGAISGTAILGLVSDGTGIDGLGTTVLNSQTVHASGAVFAYAAGTLANGGTVALGNHHVADTVTGFATLTNSAPPGNYTEALDASLSGATTGITAGGAITGLAAGASNANSLVVGLNTGSAGSISGTAALALTSDGTGIDNLGTTALPGQTVTVTGGVYNYATAHVAGTSINFGVVHVGQAVSQALSVGNTGALGSYTEALDAQFSGANAGITTSGSVAHLLAGQIDSTDMAIGLATANAGTIAGNAVISLESDGSGIDALGTTALTGQTVAVSGIVDNYAVANFEDPNGPQITASGGSLVLNLGTVVQGGTALSTTLGVLNAATGPADLLGGSISSSAGPGFTNGGFGAFSGLGAGQDERAQTVSLSTGAAGTFSETVTLTASGSNASGYSGALPTETLTVVGTVVAATPTVYMITGIPQTITGAAGGDLFVAGAGTLNSRDRLTGGSGTDALLLSGGGVFDLNAPATLANIPNVYATEGQVPMGWFASATPPIVLLRDGTAETLNVISGTPAFGNSNPESISIYGGTGADVVNLGEGSDLVVLGSAQEKVNGGGGTALVQATITQAGALVKGTAIGSTTLEITNGGTATLNAADSNLIVKLDAASHLTLSKMSFITAEGSTGADTITAMAQGQTLTGGGGNDTLIGYSGFGDLFSDTSANLNTATIQQFGGSDVIDLTDMNSSLIKPLTYTGTTSAGTLTVSDGTHTAKIKFTGDYTPANFQMLGSDSHTGSLIGFH
jgi:hypothetical protein